MKVWGISMLAAAVLAAPASAQELRFEFRNPSFGGNPFNSDHLLAIAAAQKPERPRTSTGTGSAAPTEAELFARQLQSRLLSALSSSVVQAITGAAPGTSGEFNVGGQNISFERTLNEIRLTIFDESTGETTEIVVPVLSFSGPGAQSLAATTSTGTSAESSLLGQSSAQSSTSSSSLDIEPLTGLTGN